MSEPDAKIPPGKSPFWRFSIKFYAVPGVAQACIELQDQAKVDVNLDTKQVKVDSTAEPGRIVAALKEAGYEPA